MSNEIVKTETEAENTAVMAQTSSPEIFGFEETNSEDIVIPRIKVINALSPERTDGIAEEGDVINSLTKESVVGKRFIPIKQYYSKIEWNEDRDDDQRILCYSRDGKVGTDINDNKNVCASCKKCMFDNTKTGKDSQPVCTSYMNFLGFFEGDPMPVVLSFAKTNYNEGKKMLSIARSLRCNIWDYGYMLTGKKVAKGRNVWFNIETKLDKPTDEATRAIARELYNVYANIAVNVDYEDVATAVDTTLDADIVAEI